MEAQALAAAEAGAGAPIACRAAALAGAVISRHSNTARQTSSGATCNVARLKVVNPKIRATASTYAETKKTKASAEATTIASGASGARTSLRAPTRASATAQYQSRFQFANIR